jgi:hypothetical protein
MVAKGVWRLPSKGNYVQYMSPDAELLVIFGVLHFVALALGGVLFVMFLRSDGASSWPQDDEDDGGGGGNDRISDKPKTSPSGGIPLPSAVQSNKRLRSSLDKLADPSRRRVRQREHQPIRIRPRVPVR